MLLLCYSLVGPGFEGSLLPWLQTERGWQGQGGDRRLLCRGQGSRAKGDNRAAPPARGDARAERVQWPQTGSAPGQSPGKRWGTANQTMRSEPVGILMAMISPPCTPLFDPHHKPSHQCGSQELPWLVPLQQKHFILETFLAAFCLKNKMCKINLCSNIEI